MTNAGEKNNAAAWDGHLARQAFWAMVQRNLLIQARDAWEFVFRVAMLPFILILTYGFVLPTLGVLPESFPSQMFAGMVGMSMLITGIHGTAVPFTMDFNNMHEIEDRLQAPVSSTMVGLSKMLVGIIESFVGGLIVLPISLVFMGSRIDVTMGAGGILPLVPVLVLISVASATLGLLVGTIIKPNQIAAMFPRLSHAGRLPGSHLLLVAEPLGHPRVAGHRARQPAGLRKRGPARHPHAADCAHAACLERPRPGHGHRDHGRPWLQALPPHGRGREGLRKR